MAPNDYYPSYYNAARSHTDQQSYGTYQPQISAPPAAQYQQARAPTTAHQPDSYQGYTQQYAQQSPAYGGTQSYSSNNWYALNTNNADEGRAAETLSRMSNTEQDRPDVVPHTTGVANHGSNAVQGQPHLPTYVQSSDLAQQKPARPNSVNSGSSERLTSNRPQSPAPLSSATPYQPQQVQSIPRLQHRSASPEQVMHAMHCVPPSTRPASAISAAQQPDMSHRTLPNVTQTYQGNAAATTPTTHYVTQRSFPPSNQPFMNGNTREYEQSVGTVDPTQVYDPWPEYHRKLEAAKAAKVKEEAAAAAKVEREAEERKKVEEANRAAEEARAEEEQRRRAQEAENVRKAKEAEQVKQAQEQSVAKSKATKSQQPSTNDNSKKSEAAKRKVNNATRKAPASDADEIKALMERMRELNAKNPALLAQMWEEERRRNGSTTAMSPKAPTQAVSHPGQVNGTGATATSAATSKSSSQGTQQQVSAPQKANPKPAPPRPTQATAPVAKPQTIWPPEKKGQLAAAAAKWLNGIPENHDKPLSSDYIASMLDSNPTYIDLCEKLEIMGIRLERASFARALLTAVPDINSTAQTRSQPQPQPLASNEVPHPPSNGIVANGTTRTSGQSQDHAVDLRAPQPTPQPNLGRPIPNITPPLPGHVLNGASDAQSDHQHVNGGLKSFTGGTGAAGPVRSPYFSSQPPPFPAPVVRMVPPSGTRPSDIKSAIKLPVSNQASASKAEAARKRTFADIVDLTSLSDDEPPVKMPFVPSQTMSTPPPGPAPVHVPGSAPVAPIGYIPAPVYSAPDASFRPYNIPVSATPRLPGITQVPPVPSLAPRPQVAVDEKIISAELVKPLDKRKALRRSAYNVNTIARDVLLATSRHPDMRGLNSHLEILKATFKQVDNAADLSTFRWDLVDPGDPIVDIADNNRDSVLDDADDEEDENTPANAQPRVIIRQPVGPEPGGASGTEVVGSAFGVMRLSKGPVNVIKRRRGRPARHSDPGVTTRPHGFGDAGDQQRDSSHSQRGSDTPRNSSSRSSGAAQSSANMGTPTSRAAAPSALRSGPPASGTGYSALRQHTFGPDGTPPPKKRGRPVGWRKNPTLNNETPVPVRPRPAQPSGLRNVQTASGDGVVVVIPSRSSSVVTGPSGAQSSKKKPSPPEPNYSVYKCMWQDCSAELHNLETLRKHVIKLHGKEAAQGGYNCLWSNCGDRVLVADRRTGRKEKKHRWFDFSTQKAWMEHVEQEHLTPLAWELGDGPAGGLSDVHDSGSEAYLSDNRGRRVTPTVRIPPSSEADESQRLVPPTGRSGRPRKTEEQKATEEQKRLEQKKREVGPGIDKSGATLANTKRRTGFLDDEDFEEIVDDDFLHGGAWRDPAQSSTELLPAQSLLLAEPSPHLHRIAGLASVNYRLSPHPAHPTDDPAHAAKHPQHIHDVLEALAWLRGAYGVGASRRWVAVGHSCGATLALQLCMDRAWTAAGHPLDAEAAAAAAAAAAAEGERAAAPPVAVVGLEGLYDLPLLARNHEGEPVYGEILRGAFGGDEGVWRAASPVSGRFESSWPRGRVVVLGQSVEDELVEWEQVEVMAGLLRGQGWMEREEGEGEGRPAKELVVMGLKGSHDGIWEEGAQLARAIEVAVAGLFGEE